MITILSITISASAMSYEQARREALFLTDKMAYELNLSDQQYDAAYEINLDYLMGVTGRDDVYGTYWDRRNLDMSYILFDWQWNAFCAATYFYRPLYWNAGYWHFGIYARYPRRDYFYFGRPTVYVSYCGGHSWHHNGGHSYYKPRTNSFRTGTTNHVGLRDRWNNGETNRNNGSRMKSSTRVTVNNNTSGSTRPNIGSSKTGGSFSGSRTNTTTAGKGNGISYTPAGGSNSNVTNTTTGGSRTGGTFSGSRTSGSFGTARTTTTATSRNTGTTQNASIATNRVTTTGKTAVTSVKNTAVKRNAGTVTRMGTAARNAGTSPRSTVSGTSKSASRISGGSSSKTSGGFSGRR